MVTSTHRLTSKELKHQDCSYVLRAPNERNKFAQALSVLTCDILNMTSSPTKKKTYLLKKYWQMFGGNCFFFWKIFRLKSCTYTYANKIIRAIFLIPWFPRILLGRVWPTNWHPGVSSEIAPTRPGRPWQEVILSATGGSSLVNVQRPCFPAVG